MSIPIWSTRPSEQKVLEPPRSSKANIQNISELNLSLPETLTTERAVIVRSFLLSWCSRFVLASQGTGDEGEGQPHGNTLWAYGGRTLELLSFVGPQVQHVHHDHHTHQHGSADGHRRPQGRANKWGWWWEEVTAERRTGQPAKWSSLFQIYSKFYISVSCIWV